MRFTPIPISPHHPESAAMKTDPIMNLPPSPPHSYQSSESDGKQILQSALHTIRTERDALDNLLNLYATSDVAQQGLSDAVEAILDSQNRSGKLVISGVGKSAIVARKAIATLTSLHIQCRFLDPLAALHGDLGMISEVIILMHPGIVSTDEILKNDTLMFISHSGRTHELVEVVSTISTHLNMGYLPMIAVTGQMKPSECALFDHYPLQSCILLPAPIPISEKESFGLPAPTTSTTVAFATLDALALILADVHHPEPAGVFHRYHPGGSIGAHHARFRPDYSRPQ